MDKVFYILYALALIGEMGHFANPKDRLDQVNKLKKDTKGVGVEDWPKDTRGPIFLSIAYVLLTLVGLFTFQWWAFVAIIVFSIIPKRVVWWVRIDAFVTILLILFIIINKFHFHYTPF